MTRTILTNLGVEPCDYTNDRNVLSRHYALSTAPLIQCQEDGISQRALKFSLLPQGYLSQALSVMANACFGCNGCVPLRVNTQKFYISNSQRRLFTKNQYHVDLFDMQDLSEDSLFNLYTRYQRTRHPKSAMAHWDIDRFEKWVSVAQYGMVLSKLIPAHDGQPPKTQMVGYAVIDAHDKAWSLEYNVFDPAFEADSPGKRLWIYAAALAKIKGIEHVYVGSWKAGSPTLDYKKYHKGLEAHVDGEWVDFDPERHRKGPNYPVMLQALGHEIA